MGLSCHPNQSNYARFRNDWNSKVKTLSSVSSDIKEPRLLLVETDNNLCQASITILKKVGFRVVTCNTGKEALNALNNRQISNPFDLVVLSHELPDIKGLGVCQELRDKSNNIPILLISNCGHESDRVLGLEIGADDYLVKPYGGRELAARCKALFRRVEKSNQRVNSKKILSGGDISIDLDQYSVMKNGQALKLAPKAYKLLKYLMSYPDKVHSRDEILEAVWPNNLEIDHKTIDVHIRWLREKVEDDTSVPRYIHTVRGFGYMFAYSS